MRRRPIGVWVIFAYSAYVAVIAIWAAASIRLAQFDAPGTPPHDDYGALELAVSLIPASVLAIAGLSLFMLKKWTIWFFGLTALIGAWSLYLTPSSNGLLWLVIALLVCTYAIYLRRGGALS